MKQVIISLGVTAVLSACTVVPVPVAVITPVKKVAVNYQTLPNTLPVAYIPETMPAPAMNMAVSTPTTPAKAPLAVNPAILDTYQTTTFPTAKPQDLTWIAERIYQNETGGKPENLVRWNATGNYAQLGIGRFSWYPRNTAPSAQPDSFPELLQYMQVRGIKIPTWLSKRPTRGGPWRTKSDFDKARNDKEMRELQQLLASTKNLQANFMLERLKQATPELLSQFSTADRSIIERNYQLMLQSPKGLYPMLDYISFKGDGLNPNDRYRSQGWGLAHVLLNMHDAAVGPTALDAFASAAEDLLIQRIANAPTENREARFLQGWKQRLNTYKQDSLLANR